jgi:23S rRNA (guanine2445-N2)-methyltransferase / 23S rRNA (guanine2069-N7)-methyltransferase
MELVVSCSPGLEALLAKEITELCPRLDPSIEHGAVRMQAPLEPTDDELREIYLRSRLASRIHSSLRSFAAQNAAMLYDQTRRVAWQDFLSPEKSFIVHSRGESKAFDLRFAGLKVKDAICDEVRKHFQGERPNVDRENPDVRITLFHRLGRCEISLDLSRDVLHRRGYRMDAGEAPLRENRAAALVRLTASLAEGHEEAHDPFCGSGTLLIEWASLVLGAPRALSFDGEDPLFKLRPDLKDSFRKRHQELMQQYRKNIEKRVASGVLLITGSDTSTTALEAARKNLKAAGLEKVCRLEKGDALKLETKARVLLANPPYGERLEDTDAAIEILKVFGRHVKHHLGPCTLGVALAKTGLTKHLGFKPDLKLAVDNGPIPIELSVIKIYAGRAPRPQSSANESN